MNVKQVLEESRQRIERPDRWCQGTLARDRDGVACDPGDLKAVSFCAAGAVEVVVGGLWGLFHDARKLLDECATEMGYAPDPMVKPSAPIAYLNDNSDHATVLKAYDCAISKAK